MPQKTIADTLAARDCGHPMCCKSTKLDIQALIDRLGPDHGAMHEDLAGLFGCAKCKAAGRDRRPVFFTVIPDYEGHQRQRNRDWKPTFEKRWGLAGTRVLVRLAKAKGCLVTGQSVWHSNCVVSKTGYPTPRQSSD